MAVTRERFNQGMTYEQFKAMTRNREAFERSEQALSLQDGDLAPFARLPRPLNVAVIITESCPDVVMNLPILDRIARESGQLRLRIFLRDDNKDLIAQYMNGPYESVPVFVFFDEDWNERGVWIERPRAVVEMRERRTREIYASDPEFGSPDAPPADLPDDLRGRLQAAIRDMRVETGPLYARETIRDLGQMMDEIGHDPAPIRPQWRGNLAAVPA